MAARRRGERRFKDAFGIKSDPFRKKGERRGRRLSQSKKKGSQFPPIAYRAKDAAEKAKKAWNKGARYDTQAVLRFSKARGEWDLYKMKRKPGKMKGRKPKKTGVQTPRRIPSKEKQAAKLKGLPKGMKLSEAMQKLHKTGRYSPDYDPSWEG